MLFPDLLLLPPFEVDFVFLFFRCVVFRRCRLFLLTGDFFGSMSSSMPVPGMFDVLELGIQFSINFIASLAIS